jgi:hypothetical protein
MVSKHGRCQEAVETRDCSAVLAPNTLRASLLRAAAHLDDDARVAAFLQVALGLLHQLSYQQHDGAGAVPA